VGRKEKVISEVKINVVEQYLKGLKSTIQISSELNVNAKTVEGWIVKYRTFGPGGLITQRNNVSYQPQVKHDAVIDYLNGKGSLRDICIKYKISSRSILRQWIKKYNGHKALKSSYTKGVNVMTNGRKTTYEERVEIVAFCMANSKNYHLTAKKFKVSYQQVYGWVNKYESTGHEALVDRRGKHKTFDELNESQKLAAQLKLLEAENRRLKLENEFLKKLEEIERR